MIDSSLANRLGASVLPGGGVQFRVWAPRARHVEVELEMPRGAVLQPLRAVGDGFFTGVVPEAGPGSRYRYRLDGGVPLPDPASRFQPAGPHGPSEVIDPRTYSWGDADWRGLPGESLVIYELHVGTFSPEGTFEGIIPHLPYLADLGISAIELMPVAEFPGRWNWGYDGVDLFAPASVYGGPIGLKRLVDAAHQHGLGVIQDVVYNHLGPDGNYLRAFAPEYFTSRYTTPWGDALNYDGPGSAPVRQFVLENARRWLEEYHVDGLRLDATHAIHDASPRHLLAELAEVAHDRPRSALIIAEDHRNDVRFIDPPARGGYGLDAVWADDFHHALHTYLTGEHEGYYADFSGRLEDVGRVIEGGFLYQGQPRPSDGQPRGTTVTDQPARAFVFCIQNHDQIGNRALGERLCHLVDRPRYLLAAAALLLSPETALLFQGEEFASSAPFLYFTDHHPELGRLVTEGRRNEFRRFSAFSDPVRRERIPDPQAPATFERSRLDLSERERNADVLASYRRLLHLRRDDAVLRWADRGATRARTSGPDLLAIHRWRGAQHRLALLNFGAAVTLVDAAVFPDLPSPDAAWRTLWASGAAPTVVNTGERTAWQIPPRSGMLLAIP